MMKQGMVRSAGIRHWTTVALVVVALLLFPAAVALADTYTVDRADDDAGASDCDSRVLNDCSLRGAVSAANTNPGLDTIVLPDRTFNLDLHHLLSPEDNNESGDLDISASGGSLRVQGAGKGQTIIRGGYATLGSTSGIDRVFHVDPLGVGGIRVEISGVSIEYGYGLEYGGGIRVDGDNLVTLEDSAVMSNTVLVVGTPGGGGGIFNDEGTFILTNTDVMTNTAKGLGPNSDPAGGGILAEFTAVVSLTSSTISGNEATVVDVTGSSVRGGGLANLHGEMYVRHSLVTGNTATGGAGGSLGMGGGIANADAGRLTIDHDSIVSDNMADLYGGGLSSSGSSVSIDDSTFDGNAITGGADGLAGKGGGIYNKAGTMQIISTTLESNEAVTLVGSDHLGDGGGIASSGGNVELTDSLILSNVADNHCGGIRSENGSTLLFDGGAVSLNEAGSTAGGLCSVDSTAFMTDTTIALNTTEGSGGGIVASGGDVTLTRCLFFNNKALGGYGGGVYQAFCALSIVDTTLYANRADISGGGLYGVQGYMRINGSTFMGNAAADSPSGGSSDNHGGAIFLVSSTAHLVNSTISTNRADESGGGVYSDGSTLSLSNVSVADNMADADDDGNGDGGGLFAGSSSPSIVNTILAGNTDRGGEVPDCGGIGLMTYGDNIIQDRTGCSVAGGPGTNLVADPMLDALGDNGGPTDTHALLEGSPAIDGAASYCLTYHGVTVDTDQRGVSRPVGVACDIGAYEGTLYRVYLPLVVRNFHP